MKRSQTVFLLALAFSVANANAESTTQTTDSKAAADSNAASGSKAATDSKAPVGARTSKSADVKTKKKQKNSRTTSSVMPNQVPASDSIQTSAASAQIAVSDVSTSATSVSTTEGRFIDKISLSYFGYFAGPSLGQVSALTPDSDGTQSSAQNLDAALTLGFKAAQNTTLGFSLNHVLEPVMGNGIQLKDPALKITQANVIDSNGLKLKLEMRGYLPTTQASRDLKLVTQLRAIQVLSYDIGRWSLGTYSYLRYNAFSELTDGSYDSKLYFAPFANYQFAEKLAATFWVDLIQANNKRGESLTSLTNPLVTAQAGVNWDITPNFGLNPFVNVVPGNLNVDSSYAGMIVSAKFL